MDIDAVLEMLVQACQTRTTVRLLVAEEGGDEELLLCPFTIKGPAGGEPEKFWVVVGALVSPTTGDLVSEGLDLHYVFIHAIRSCEAWSPPMSRDHDG